MESFIPVKVVRNVTTMSEDECNILCYPRSITLDVSYYQVNQWEKRIIEAKMIFEDFDKQHETSNYALKVKFYPLVSINLMNEIFTLFF